MGGEYQKTRKLYAPLDSGQVLVDVIPAHVPQVYSELIQTIQQECEVKEDSAISEQIEQKLIEDESGVA